MMFRVKCLECGNITESEFSGRELRKLTTHLQHSHNMSKHDYIVKHFHKGKKPICLCGCKNFTKLSKWKFNIYYKDHKNKMKSTPEVKLKISNGLRKMNNMDNIDITVDDLKEAFDLYKKPEYNSKDISKKYGRDFRVIKKYIIDNNIASREEMKKYAILHKNKWGNMKEKNGQFQAISIDILLNAYEYLINCGKKITLSFLRNKFNVKESRMVLYGRLVEKFGKEEIDSNLRKGIRSDEEINFSYILEYYFGEKNIEPQFKLERKVYDFLLFDKLIIEYDGNYWHEKEVALKNDEIKTEIAIRNNYEILRVKGSERKNISVLIEIEDKLKEMGIIK